MSAAVRHEEMKRVSQICLTIHSASPYEKAFLLVLILLMTQLETGVSPSIHMLTYFISETNQRI
jgi:hypothetical protein